MNISEVLTTEQILNAEDLYELQDSFCGSGISFKYELTDSELNWLTFVYGKYSIADWIKGNMTANVLTFDCPFTLSEVLDEDCKGAGKAVCLSEDSALQRLFFWLYTDSAEYDH